VITPPSTLYRFWRISPFDLVVFVVGFTITIFNNVENGLFAMIGLSLGIQLWRIFKAHGHVLGKVNIRTVHHETKEDYGDFEESGARSVFLPLDKHDGSNPQLDIQRPYPGVFIYRTSEGFNFPNANHQLEQLTELIKEETRPTMKQSFDKKGDRPWNEGVARNEEELGPDLRPTLKAVILDFSAVNHIDLTAVQALVDTRNLLDRHTAPHTVQWHFACIHNRWARRALASAGFGFPSFETDSGTPQHFIPVYSLAEQAFSADLPQEHEKKGSAKPKDEESAAPAPAEASTANDEFIRVSFDIAKQGDTSHVDQIEAKSQSRGSDAGNAASLTAEKVREMAVLHGINRPYFHPDLQSALISAIALEKRKAKDIGLEISDPIDEAYTKPPKDNE
jgi:sodium-independent sulfate anion transporter 11